MVFPTFFPCPVRLLKYILGGSVELKSKYQIEFKTVKRGFVEKHLYIVDGTEYPSVTAILGLIDDGKSGGLMGWARNVVLSNLKEALIIRKEQQVLLDDNFINEIIEEAKKEPDRLKDEACDVGSQCHNAIDEFIKGQDYETKLIDEKAKTAFQNFMDWINFNGYKFISGDIPVVSLKYGYGGRLDALGQTGNDIILFDWKTSNSIRDTYLLQVSAYAIALQETYDIEAKHAFIVRFSKDNSDVEEKQVNLKKAKKCFLDLLKFKKSYDALKEEK